jgi:adenine-specific DNA-methyltransferase
MTTFGVKYIGSKNSLIPDIISFVETHLPSSCKGRLFLDCFTGTTRVAQAFRDEGWSVVSSDLSWASEAYANAFLIRTSDSGKRIPELIESLKKLDGKGGWLSSTYCDVPSVEGGSPVRMWTPENGAKADVIRDKIAEWESTAYINHHESMILTACLIFALDKVDSSVGVQQAYLKSYATRAKNPLTLVDLPFPNGPIGSHLIGDCLKVEYPKATVAYLDPPYSAHSYATYYHIWDSITRWDKPQVGLKTNRRIDRVAGESFDTNMVSPWNSKKTALKAFMELVQRLPVKYVVISYNDESIVPLEDLEEALKKVYTKTLIHHIPYKRNIMCQIGNAEGKEDKKTENNEVLIWVDKTD